MLVRDALRVPTRLWSRAFWSSWLMSGMSSAGLGAGWRTASSSTKPSQASTWLPCELPMLRDDLRERGLELRESLSSETRPATSSQSESERLSNSDMGVVVESLLMELPDIAFSPPHEHPTNRTGRRHCLRPCPGRSPPRRPPVHRRRPAKCQRDLATRPPHLCRPRRAGQETAHTPDEVLCAASPRRVSRQQVCPGLKKNIYNSSLTVSRFDPLDDDQFNTIQQSLMAYLQAEYIGGPAESDTPCM